MSLRPAHSRSRLAALCAAVSGLALILSACGSNATGESATGNTDSSAVEDADSSAVSEEPDYDGLPADLTSDEVCTLLNEEAVADILDAEVTKMTPGSYQTDCTWTYQLPGGPATNLQVQVMSMSQTSNRLGTEALEWGLGRAPQGSEITEIASLNAPNMSYKFGASTVIFAADPASRVITVSAPSEVSGENRVAAVAAVLAALTENHS